MRILRTVIFCLFTLGISCVIGYASDSLIFMSPVDHEVKLSGNFMELRTNHFHTGIDIKSSNGKTGDVIKSVADGYVARIKVQSGSYGQVLYINHPNGLTSVYAHLETFNPEIEKWVKAMQYSLESFEVDLYLTDSLFVVTAGDQIGTMGNTGRSFGPHLHFEIRDTESEAPVNPEAFGFGPKDEIAPTLESLVIYSIDKLDRICDTEIKYFNPNSKNYQLYSDPIEISAEKVAFGLQCHDRINGSYNKNGINSYRVLLDDSLIVSWKAEDYNFVESKKINGFLDYKRNMAYGHKVYRLFSPSCNSLNSFGSANLGVIQLDDKIHSLKIEVSDFFNNVSQFDFNIIKRQVEEEIAEKNYKCNSSQTIKLGMFEVVFEESTFFDELDSIQLSKSENNVMGQRCHKLEILDNATAIAKYYSVSCPIPPSDVEKWTFVSKDKKGRWVHFGSDTIANRLITRIDQLGEIYVYKDTIAPTIRELQIDTNRKRAWRFEIKDNLIPDGRVDDLFYEARVDEKWVLIKYDIKSNQLIFDDFDNLPSAEFEFVLRVRDNQNNTAEYRRKIAANKN